MLPETLKYSPQDDSNERLQLNFRTERNLTQVAPLSQVVLS